MDMNNPAYFHRQSVAYLHAILNNNAARVGDEVMTMMMIMTMMTLKE